VTPYIKDSMYKIAIHLKTKRNKGFTLIETLMVIFILSIIAFVSTPAIRQGIDAWVFCMSTNDLVDEGRLAMRRLTKELKLATSITEMTSPAITFTRPGLADPVQFIWSANVLYRRVLSVPVQDNILARDLSAFSFSYLKRNSNRLDPATSPGEVWEIGIDFTVTKEGRSLRFGSTVSPRNLTH